MNDKIILCAVSIRYNIILRQKVTCPLKTDPSFKGAGHTRYMLSLSLIRHSSYLAQCTSLSFNPGLKISIPVFLNLIDCIYYQ